MNRYVFRLGGYAAKKLALIQLYNSQFAATPQSIDEFTPAVALSNAPHEAIWSDEPVGTLLPDGANQFEAKP